MGLRFQRRIKILPGVTLNLSKSGISTSVGVRGARVTFGKKGTRTTVGLPGTGISYTKYRRRKSSGEAVPFPASRQQSSGNGISPEEKSTCTCEYHRPEAEAADKAGQTSGTLSCWEITILTAVIAGGILLLALLLL